MKVVDALNWRYATKAFDKTKKISEEDWKELEESMRLAPSAFGLQPWKIHIVTDDKVKNELMGHSWNQSQVADCSHLVVISFLETMDKAYIEKFVQDISKARGIDVESLKGYQDMMNGALLKGEDQRDIPDWAARQSYIMLGFLMMAAAVKEIDTCALEGIVPAKYQEVLGIKAPYKTISAVACGYRAEEDKYASLAKVRFSSEEVFERV